jgi:hypothetical protein
VRLNRRKITLQLTPLLELMLIVFFMQYLDLLEREMRTTATAVAAEEETSLMREELEAARRVAADSLRAAEELRGRVSELEGSASQFRERAAEEQSRLSDVLRREKTLGGLVVELFGISRDDVDRILDENLGAARSPKEVEEIKKRFQQMSQMESSRMIRHVLLYEEIRKRADVWELVVDPQHVVTVNTGSRTARMRLHLSDEGDPDIGRFEEEFFQLYKSLPEPKSLVIILLTYDRETRLIVTEALADALPRITRRLADDARGTIRFEYADLGIRVEP